MSPTQSKFDKLKENLNLISIALMVIVQCLLSLLTIENGEIAFKAPTTVIAWLFWIGQLLITVIIGVVILSFFRREGIRRGHKSIKPTYDEYLMAINAHAKERRPRSLKEYMTKEGLKDTASKVVVYILVTLITGSLLISPNWNNIVSLVTNIILAVGFGIKTMLSAENFVTEELCVWYKKKILEMEEQKNDKQILSTGSECITGHAITSGIQPQEECATGQSDKDASRQPEQAD